MRRLALGDGRAIDRFGSAGAFVQGLSRDVLQVVVIRIEAGGAVGRHPTGCAQVFAAVSGSGWVSGADGRRVPIAAGEAVVWEAGEEHESGSDEGLIALSIEAERLDV